jgi:hypothetical protein
MNVLTTATDASEIAVAAGMPSSRTRPEDCRVNRPELVAGLLPIEAPLVAMLPPLTQPSNGDLIGRFQNHMPSP